MDIYLKEEGGATLRLPVMPERISIHRERRVELVDLLSLGEVEFKSGSKIKEITFESFFPKEYDSGYCRYPDIPDPQTAMQQLTSWIESEKPIRLIVTETQVNVLVTINVHDSDFVGGEPGDVYYSLTLHTYREIKVRTAAEKNPTASTKPKSTLNTRTDTKPKAKTYTVKSGDTLYMIAKRELGNGNRWREIYDLNKKTIGSNPDVIKVGMVLVMPSG